MVNKIVIMLLNCDPGRPATLAVPFFQASAAAAMDLEVEIHFAAQTVTLLRQGVAENLFPGSRQEKPLYAFMQEAHQLGVKFYACYGAVGENDIHEGNAIPEMDGVRGGAAFIGAAVSEGVLTLTY